MPPVPRGRWCPPGRLTVTDRHPPLHSGQSLNPAGVFRLAGLTLTRHQTEVHSRSPVRSSPCLWLPDGTGTLGRLLRASHPAVTSNACRSGDRSTDTDLKRTYGPTAAPPSRCICCAGATSCRTRNCVLAPAPNRGGDPRQSTSETPASPYGLGRREHQAHAILCLTKRSCPRCRAITGSIELLIAARLGQGWTAAVSIVVSDLHVALQMLDLSSVLTRPR